MDLKVAVVINGIVRLSLDRTRYMLSCFKEQFPFADFYYHTWSERINQVPKECSSSLLHCPEPELTYNPIVDVPEEPNVSEKWKRRRDPKETWAHMKFRFGHFQIIGYADAISKINKDYDVFVRGRWDSEISTKVNFLPYLQKAHEEGPVGFSPHAPPDTLIHELHEQPKDLSVVAGRWHCLLPDNMIFHAKRHFNPQLVFDLHEKKALHTAEYGWWQTMSHPYGGDIHTTILNGLHVRRK